MNEYGRITRMTNTALTRRELLRGALIVGAGAAFGPAIAACGGESESTSPTSTAGSGVPKKGGSLRVGVVGGSAKDRLDIMQANFEPEIALSFQLGDLLLGWDQDYRLEYRLADEVTPNKDATEWIVRIRQDAMFSDGRPITADDVVFSYKRIVDPDAPMPGKDALGTLTPGGISKVDARTVKFSLDEPNAILNEGFAYRSNFIYPTDWSLEKPIGCGPFVLETFNPGEQFELTRNPNYWGEGPYVDELTILEFADTTARVNAFISGAVDAMSQLPASQIEIVTGAGKNVLNAECGAYQPLTMRIDQKPFNDVRVRQAFRLIPDRQGMIDQAYSGLG